MTSVSRAGAAPRPDTGFGALLPFVDAFRRRAFAGLPPALERLFIASTACSGQSIVAGEGGPGHGLGARTRPFPIVCRQLAQDRTKDFVRDGEATRTMAAWKVALRLSRRLRMVPALSSAEGRDRHAAEGGSLAQKRGLDSPEWGGRWGLPDCENAPAILGRLWGRTWQRRLDAPCAAHRPWPRRRRLAVEGARLGKARHGGALIRDRVLPCGLGLVRKQPLRAIGLMKQLCNSIRHGNRRA